MQTGDESTKMQFGDNVVAVLPGSLQAAQQPTVVV